MKGHSHMRFMMRRKYLGCLNRTAPTMQHVNAICKTKRRKEREVGDDGGGEERRERRERLN